ncbi:MAG TPA: PKD domain-containing protein [Tahibacter sp.]|uniref:PKD domain-containing protein n=1 Tax=Tahibacter sp. TaxID=2056211 RepID=UPI002CF2446C|nr:PKD domain-containing protein [Tahibacter sp.]HSX60929.1 PKD domain-containing protein [Tahibacter sp.]
MHKSFSDWRAWGAFAGLVLLPLAPASAWHRQAKHIDKLAESEIGHAPGQPREESWQIEQRQLWFERTRALRDNPDAGRERAAAVETLKQLRRSKDPQQEALGESWAPVGPSSMTMTDWIMGRVAGRLNAVTPVPGNEDTVYIGSAAGGVWKTTNAGASWTPIFDQVGTLPIGAVTLDPNNTNVVWVGTGDKNGGGCAGYFGQGVFLSEDAGATWNARNGSGPTAMPLSIVNAVAVQPTDSNVILAGGAGTCAGGSLSGAGVFRSADRGLTWTRVLSTNVEDIVFVPGTNIAYTGLINTGVSKSVDGGATWTPMNTGLNPAGSRMRLTMSPSDSNTLYALVGDRLYRTIDGGLNWSQTNADACEGQCGYNLTVAVHPTDASTVLVGTIRHARSTNGGATLTAMTSTWGTSQKVHQDTHVVRYSTTNPNRFWVGTDGGLWRTDDGGLSYVNMNSNLNIMQFYDIAVHPNDVNIVFGGAQDNGSSGRRTSLQWGLTFASGDGFMNVVDPTTPSRVFQTSYPQSNMPTIVRSNASGSLGSFELVPRTGLVASSQFPWVTPLAAAGNQLFVASNTLYRTTTDGNSWTAVSPNMGSASSVITPQMIGVLMPTYVGTSGGRIYFSADASVPSPTFANVTGDYPGGIVSDVAMDPTNAQRVFITRAGFGNSRLYRSTTGGTAWTAVGTGLPNVPANSVAVDPLNTNRIFVGTDIGVYESTDGGDNFTAFSAGLPLGLVVQDLEIDDTPHVLTAGSYSRGAWRVVLSTSATNAPPTPDFSATVNDLTAAFTSSAIDFDGTIATTSWNFGDGSPASTQPNPTHTYATYGAKTVVLTVTDDDGASASFSRVVRLFAPPVPLSNGVTVSGQSAPQNDELRYSLQVPVGATNLSFVTTGAAGEDADLSVILNGETLCESAGATADETCNIPNPPPAGNYLVIVLAYSALSNQSITGSYSMADLIFRNGFEP